MPYASISELPPGVKNNLPSGAARIWMAAYNAASKTYKGDKTKAAATAWAAVKKKYRKKGDTWVAIDSADFTDIQLEEQLVLDFSDDKAVRYTPDGYLVAAPRIARTGIQIYRGAELGRPQLADVRVYRPEAEVFSKAAMRSFAWRPITVDHPDEEVNSKNWRKYGVGQVGEDVARDGEFIRVPLVLMDQAAIDAVQQGKSQLSVGYGAKLIWDAGTTDDGEEYDAIQTAIRANHVAIVSVARGGDKLAVGDDDEHKEADMPTDDDDDDDDLELLAGEPSVSHDDSLYFDREFSTAEREKAAAKGQAMSHGGFPIKNEKDLRNAIRAIGRAKNRSATIAHIKKRAKALGLTSLLPESWKDSSHDRRSTMSTERTYNLDGVSITLEDRDLQLLERHLGQLNKKITDGETALASVQAQLSTVQKSTEQKDGEIAVLKKQLADNEITPSKLDAMLDERYDVIERARELIGDAAAVRGKSVAQIKRETVASILGEQATKAMNDEAVHGAFVYAVAKPQDQSGGLRRSFSQPFGRGGNGPRSEAANAYADHVKDITNRWRPRADSPKA